MDWIRNGAAWEAVVHSDATDAPAQLAAPGTIPTIRSAAVVARPKMVLFGAMGAARARVEKSVIWIVLKNILSYCFSR